MEVEIKKISVVMCTYNGARFIREQLDSILNQTYPIYELIVQDDCSTDENGGNCERVSGKIFSS